MKIIISAVIALVVIVVVGVLGYNRYQDFRFVEDATPFLKNSSLRLNNGLRYETGGSSGITYKELFDKLDENVNETEKNILQIQTISKPRHKPLVEPVLAYLKCAQEVQRAIAAKYRKKLEAESAIERAKDSIEELKTANEYSRDMYSKSTGKALEEAKEARDEMAQAMSSLLDAASRLKTLAHSIPPTFSRDALVDVTLLDMVASRNKVEDAGSPTVK